MFWHFYYTSFGICLYEKNKKLAYNYFDHSTGGHYAMFVGSVYNVLSIGSENSDFHKVEFS